MKDYVSASEAAKMAGVTRQYIHHIIHQFPSACKIGSQIAILESEVDDFITYRTETNERLHLIKDA